MKSKIKNLIYDLIIGRDAPLGDFKNRQIDDFFIRARQLMSHEPYSRFDLDESTDDQKTIRNLIFSSITLGIVIHITIHSQCDDHEFKVFNYDFLEDFDHE